MDGPIAVVTGAASGLGAWITRDLAGRGFRVVGLRRSTDPSTVTPPLPASLWFDGEVSDPALWTRVVAETKHQLGASPTTFVSNAAFGVVGDVLEVDLLDWRRVIETNFYGPVLGIRALLPAMLAGGSGTIVIVNSVDGFLAEQEMASYITSKGALLQLARSVAVDFARRGIRCNAVCPGIIDTPGFRKHLATASDPGLLEAYRRERNPMGRFLEPAEVASVVGFLASDESRGMTGSVVTVDAGLTASYDYRTATVGG